MHGQALGPRRIRVEACLRRVEQVINHAVRLHARLSLVEVLAGVASGFAAIPCVVKGLVHGLRGAQTDAAAVGSGLWELVVNALLVASDYHMGFGASLRPDLADHGDADEAGPGVAGLRLLPLAGPVAGVLLRDVHFEVLVGGGEDGGGRGEGARPAAAGTALPGEELAVVGGGHGGLEGEVVPRPLERGARLLLPRPPGEPPVRLPHLLQLEGPARRRVVAVRAPRRRKTPPAHLHLPRHRRGTRRKLPVRR